LRRQDFYWKAQGIVTFWPLVITTVCYLWTAYGFWSQGQPALGTCFLFYACANAGFMAIALGWR
jgi:hypothetical protein